MGEVKAPVMRLAAVLSGSVVMPACGGIVVVVPVTSGAGVVVDVVVLVTGPD